LDPAASDNYYKLTTKLYAAVDKMYGNDDPFTNAQGWYYEHVNGPYWEESGKLYDQLASTEPADKPLIYNKLRNLTIRYEQPVTHAGYTYPTPEFYQFALWTPDEQVQHIADWAQLPAEWLTPFQRDKVGYSLVGKQNKAANLVSDYAFKADRALGKWLYDHGKSSDSDMSALVDRKVAEYAQQLGVGKYWAETKQPKYVRIGKALHLGDTIPSWNTVAGWATNLRAQITAAGYSPSSASGSGQRQAYAWFQQSVNNLHDDALNKILEQLQVALGKPGRPLAPDQLLQVLFFDVYVP